MIKRWISQLILLTVVLCALPAQAELKRTPRIKALHEALVGPWLARYKKTVARTQVDLGAAPERQALRLYMLEQELVAMLEFVVGNKQIPATARRRVEQSAFQWLNNLQWSYSSAQQEMRTRQEAQSAGSSGRRSTFYKNGRTFYTPTYKTDRPLNAKERRKAYRALLTEHRAEFGKKRAWDVLDRKTLRQIKSHELIEWVALAKTPQAGKQDNPLATAGDLEVRLTRFAKHAIVAEGQSVPGAGGLAIVWGKQAKQSQPVAVFVSPWSGTYQPEIGSVLSTIGAKLVKLGVPAERILVTPMMPLSTKLYENFLKTAGMDKPTRQADARRLARYSDLRLSGLRRNWQQAVSATYGRRAKR